MILRRSLLAALGASPAMWSMPPAVPQFPDPRNVPLAAGGPSSGPAGSSFNAKRLQFLRLLGADPDLDHRLFMEAKAQLGAMGMAGMPSDIANKRSWSPAFKELQLRNRLIAEMIERDVGDNDRHDRITRFIARTIDGGAA